MFFPRPQQLKKMLPSHRGAASVEYGLLVGLVAVGLIIAVGQTGAGIRDLFSLIADALMGKRIELSSNTVAENTGAGFVIGTLSLQGISSAEPITYSVADSRFSITGNTLKTTTPFDYEATPTLDVAITASAGDIEPYTATVTIVVTNINETLAVDFPTLPIAENTAVGSAIATLSVEPDYNDATTVYAITNGNSGGIFTIDQNTLRILTALDYETTPSYTLTFTATDKTGHTVTKTENIAIGNVADIPATVILDGTAPTFLVDNSALIDETNAVVYQEKTLTFKNTGEVPTAPLTPTLTPASGSGFIIETNNCAGKTLVSADATTGDKTCTVSIRAVATTNGTLTAASLSVGNATVPLAGTATGLTSAIAFTPASTLSLTTPEVSTGLTACHDLAVKNTGKMPITGLSAVTFSGTSAANFQACPATSTPACNTTLAIGATCHLGVMGKTAVNGTYTASAVFSTATPRPLTFTAAYTDVSCASMRTRILGLGGTFTAGTYSITPAGGSAHNVACDSEGWTQIASISDLNNTTNKVFATVNDQGLAYTKLKIKTGSNMSLSYLTPPLDVWRSQGFNILIHALGMSDGKYYLAKDPTVPVNASSPENTDYSSGDHRGCMNTLSKYAYFNNSQYTLTNKYTTCTLSQNTDRGTCAEQVVLDLGSSGLHLTSVSDVESISNIFGGTCSPGNTISYDMTIWAQ